jgi:hypothetical protein
MKEQESISELAAAYLREITGNGEMKYVRVEHAEAKYKSTTIYGEDIRDYIEKLDKEYKAQQKAEKEPKSTSQRYDVDDVPDKFVLKHGKKFFYGFKRSEVKWTHDIRLALAVAEFEAEALSTWFEHFEIPVTKFPDPKKLKSQLY